MERNNTQHAESLRTKLFASSAGLSLDELDSVVGGASKNKKKKKENTVRATCEHCGKTGEHQMTSGSTAQCCRCGKTINLKAQ